MHPTQTPDPAPKGQGGSHLIAYSIIATMVLVLVARFFDSDTLWHIAWAACGGTVLVNAPYLRFREFYLLTICASVSAAVWWMRPDYDVVLVSALDQAGFLMVFILLLTLLREAASSSPSVVELGAFLTRQPPGRRYGALYTGTGFLAVLFNVGILSFLVPLVQLGIQRATPDHPHNPLRERRQITAVLRGFSWCVIWSPTAMAPLALFELMDGIDRLRWMVAGFGIFVLVLVVGWLDDTIRFRKYRPSGPRVGLPFPRHSGVMFGLACIWLLGVSSLFAKVSGDTIVYGLMLSCPVMLVGWLWVQNRAETGSGPEATRATRDRMSDIFFNRLPSSGPLAVTLACSGYLGRAGAGIVPGEALFRDLGLYSMPDWALLGGLPVALCLFSLFGFSPIMMAIFFGSLFGSLSEMPADPTLIALSISCGWALSMTFSPFATVVLMIQRISGIPAVRLTQGWNFTFNACVAILLVGVFAIMTL